GVPEWVADERMELALAAALALAYALVVAVAVSAARRAPDRGRAATLALLVLIATNVGLAVGTRHGDRIDGDPKYFLPLYSAVPVLAGAGLAALRGAAGVSLLGGLLAVQVAGALGGELTRLAPEPRARLAAEQQAREETLAAIERQGPDRFYTDSPSLSI